MMDFFSRFDSTNFWYLSAERQPPPVSPYCCSSTVSIFSCSWCYCLRDTFPFLSCLFNLLICTLPLLDCGVVGFEFGFSLCFRQWISQFIFDDSANFGLSSCLMDLCLLKILGFSALCEDFTVTILKVSWSLSPYFFFCNLFSRVSPFCNQQL
jgi:hypothetical protein